MLITRKTLGLLISLTALATMVAASAAATNRRLTPAAYCQTILNYDIPVPSSGYFETEAEGGTVACGIPSDSYLRHTDVQTINVHLYNASDPWYASTSARPCVYKYSDSTTVACDNEKHTHTLGNQTIAFSKSANELTNFTNPNYATWASDVNVLLTGGGSRLNMIYVTN